MHVVELVTRTLTSTRCEACLTEGPSICKDCILVLAEAPKSSCIVCNSLTLNGDLCSRCRKKNTLYSLAVCYRYEADPERILRSYKFGSDRSLAKPIANAMSEAAQPFQYDFIASVPASSQRTRARGFDHTHLLAKNIAPTLKIPIKKPLLRIGNDRQVGATREERFRQVAHQYRLAPIVTSSIQDAHILLVDDVATTGATMTRCATLLKEAGAKRVDGCVFARG